MNDMFLKFNQLFSAMNKHKVDYILIGGYAVILYGYKRGTEDIDLLINPTEENFVNLRTALNEVFSDDSIQEITLAESLKYSVTRYVTPSGFLIDIITALGEAYHYSDIRFKQITDENGMVIRIAEIDSLIEMKKNTYREKDKNDIFFLVRKRDNDAR